MSSSTGAANYRAKADYYTPVDLAEACLRAWLEAMEEAYPGFNPHAFQFLEPHVGGGAWLRAIYSLGLTLTGENVEVQDFNPHAEGLLLPGDHESSPSVRTDDLVQTGFLVTEPLFRPNVIGGNPPYGVPIPCKACTPSKTVPGPGCKACKDKGVKGVAPLAELHVARACSMAEHVIQLLRLAFLESKTRALAARKYRLRHVWVLPVRPPFAQVCPGCAGTGVSRYADPCEVCQGTKKRRRASGSDSAAYGVFWFDQAYNGEVPKPSGYDEEARGPWEENPSSWRFTTSGLEWGLRKDP